MSTMLETTLTWAELSSPEETEAPVAPFRKELHGAGFLTCTQFWLHAPPVLASSALLTREEGLESHAPMRQMPRW